MRQTLRTPLIRRWMFILVAALPCGAGAQEFSADELVHSGDGTTEKGKVYVSHDKVRAEKPSTTGGKPAAILMFDLAAQTMVVLQPDKKTYVEQKGPRAIAPVAFLMLKEGKPCDPSTTKATERCALLGRETLNGRAVDKWEVTKQVSSKPATCHLWVDVKLRFPVKWDANPQGGELQNIKEGPQAPELFTIPSGYNGISLPSRPASQ